MFCSNCGKEISDNQNFCNYCGTKVITNNSSNESNIKLNETELTNKILENKDNISNAVNYVMQNKKLDQPNARKYVDKVFKDNGIETNKSNNPNISFQPAQTTTSPLVKLIGYIMIALILLGGYKLFQPVFFPTNVQKYGYSAEFSAKQDLGQYCRENELQVKAIEENDGIYIVKCTTTNQNLIAQYGSSTFYYGYMPSASGSTYRHYTDTSKQKVYDILNK